MDSTIVVATAIILAIAILIALLMLSMKIKHKNQQKRILNAVSEFEKANNLHIDLADMFRQKFIGFDDQRRYLVFVENGDIVPKVQKIDLLEVKKADIGVHSSKTGKTSLLTSLDEHSAAFNLILTLVTREEINLSFYNEVQDGLGEREHLLAHAKKWAGLINTANKTAI